MGSVLRLLGSVTRPLLGNGASSELGDDKKSWTLSLHFDPVRRGSEIINEKKQVFLTVSWTEQRGKQR